MAGQKNIIVGLDSGSQSTRVSLYDMDLNRLYITKKAPIDIRRECNDKKVLSTCHDFITSTVTALNDAADYMSKNNMNPISMGITNQRETFTGWLVDENKDVVPSSLKDLISWQSNHADLYHDDLNWEAIEIFSSGKMNIDRNIRLNEFIYDKTGLPHTGYYSCSKISDYLRNDVDKKTQSSKDFKIGTVDSLIVYLLTCNHFTDYTNAHRTNLINVKELVWDKELLQFWNIDENILPKILDTSDEFGYISSNKNNLIFSKYGLNFNAYTGLKINSVIGDQQSSSYAHGIQSEPIIKLTLGTGGFISGLVKDSSSLKEFNNSFFAEHLYKNTSDFLQVTPLYKKGDCVLFMAENYIRTAGVGISIMQRLGLLGGVEDFDKYCLLKPVHTDVFQDINEIHMFRNAAIDIYKGTYEHLYEVVGDATPEKTSILCKKYLNLVVYDIEYNINVFINYYNSIKKRINRIQVDGGFKQSLAIQTKLKNIYKDKIRFEEDSELTVKGAALIIHEQIRK